MIITYNSSSIVGNLKTSVARVSQSWRILVNNLSHGGVDLSNWTKLRIIADKIRRENDTLSSRDRSCGKYILVQTAMAPKLVPKDIKVGFLTIVAPHKYISRIPHLLIGLQTILLRKVKAFWVQLLKIAALLLHTNPTQHDRSKGRFGNISCIRSAIETTMMRNGTVCQKVRAATRDAYTSKFWLSIQAEIKTPSNAEEYDYLDAPFLRMPLEIRYMIYSYLTPDIIIPSSFYTPSRSLRKDNEKCASALFVVNRMIHKEFAEAWYANDDAVYQIFIGKKEMRFLDHTYDASTTVVLPQSLRRIKSLRISLEGIPLIGEYDPFTEEKAERYRTNHLSGSLKLIKAVTDMLQPGKCALRNFKINMGPLNSAWRVGVVAGPVDHNRL